MSWVLLTIFVSSILIGCIWAGGIDKTKDWNLNEDYGFWRTDEN